MSSEQKKPRIICVSSGKGGVGKTSFSVNIASALAQRGKEVLLIDGDLGLANVDIVLGLHVDHNMQEIVEQERNPSELLVEISPGFKVLPASSGVPEMATLSHEKQAALTKALEDLVLQFDIVILDTAAGIGYSVLWFNKWAGYNIVIMTPDPTSMTDAYALMKVLATRHDLKDFMLVVNNVKSEKEGDQAFFNVKSALHKFLNLTPSFLGNIPIDPAVAAAVREQHPFIISRPDCSASKAISNVATRIEKM